MILPAFPTGRRARSKPLDETRQWFSSCVAAVAEGWKSAGSAVPTPRPWGGEVSPHNGDAPSCDHSSMRWATFADSLWYIDTLATAAALGHEAVCRQDLIGTDYGLLDCSTGKPLPDSWSSMLFSSLTSERVLATSAGTGAPSTLRVYVQRSNKLVAKQAGAVTLVLLNLASEAQSVQLPVTGAKLWQLTPSPEPGLGAVPGLLANSKAAGGETVALPPTSVTFAVLPASVVACK